MFRPPVQQAGIFVARYELLRYVTGGKGLGIGGPSPVEPEQRGAFAPKLARDPRIEGTVVEQVVELVVDGAVAVERAGGRGAVDDGEAVTSTLGGEGRGAADEAFGLVHADAVQVEGDGVAVVLEVGDGHGGGVAGGTRRIRSGVRSRACLCSCPSSEIAMPRLSEGLSVLKETG